MRRLNRWHTEGPAYDRHQDRHGQRRFRDDAEKSRTGRCACARRQGADLLMSTSASISRPRDRAGGRTHFTFRSSALLRHLDAPVWP